MCVCECVRISASVCVRICVCMRSSVFEYVCVYVRLGFVRLHVWMCVHVPASMRVLK